MAGIAHVKSNPCGLPPGNGTFIRVRGLAGHVSGCWRPLGGAAHRNLNLTEVEWPVAMGSTLKSILVLVILLGIIGVASYFAVTRSRPEPEEGRGYTAILMCSNRACQKVFPHRVIAGQPGPYRCKQCGRKTAYRAVRCDNCGQIFPYHVREVSTESGPEQIGTTECPGCGYDRFTRVQSMEEVKEGAAERD